MCIARPLLVFLTVVNNTVSFLGAVWPYVSHCGAYRHCYCVGSDVQEWLGYRYTERCELEAAKFHFKVTAKTARHTSYMSAILE
jgi:hypothetical protein